jgi:hypothetical protein
MQDITLQRNEISATRAATDQLARSPLRSPLVFGVEVGMTKVAGLRHHACAISVGVEYSGHLNLWICVRKGEQMAERRQEGVHTWFFCLGERLEAFELESRQDIVRLEGKRRTWRVG